MSLEPMTTRQIASAMENKYGSKYIFRAITEAMKDETIIRVKNGIYQLNNTEQ